MKKLIAVILCCFVLCFALVLFLGHGEAGQPDVTGPEQLGHGTMPPEPTAGDASAALPDDTRPDDAVVPDAAKPTVPDEETDSQAGSRPQKPSVLDVSRMGQYLVPVNQSVIYNDELQEYVDSQCSIYNNQIRLTADREGDYYRSGKVVSNIAFLYGDFTFRIHTLSGSGLFPAIWMLPETGAVLPEVDIYECIGSFPTTIYGVHHFMNGGVKEREFFDTDLPAATQEYTLSFHWDEQSLVWYLNGQPLQTFTEQVPDKPMYIIMNLAVGGSWAQPPTEDTSFPSSFQVEVLEFSPRNIRSR